MGYLVKKNKRRDFTRNNASETFRNKRIWTNSTPDTVFHRAANLNEFDIVVVMYHDQGHIPIKLLGFETGVNVTAGLPFYSHPVDHGTAFPIAGQGIADCRVWKNPYI